MIDVREETAFSARAESHRRELQVHCYRMLGSIDDAQDAVQETFLRAWRKRSSLRAGDPASFRAWLYRIATNACLDALERSPRRLLPTQMGPPGGVCGAAQPLEIPWLQPYPDTLLEGIAPSDEAPDAVLVARETIELAFLAAIQLLPPRQRAALILRDVLGWSARETAEALETSVASANSALQRARATLERELPRGRLAWAPPSEPTAEEREILRRYMDAHERGDAAAVAALLREDVRASMPPLPLWFEGRDDIEASLTAGYDRASPDFVGEFRLVPVGANRQPAAACYLRRPGESEFRAFAIDVLRIEDGKIAEMTAFEADLFPAFGLPPTLA